MIFDYIKAATFFPKYCPGVTNWTHKMRGLNGRGNPISFTLEDFDLIKAGILRLRRDIDEWIIEAKNNAALS